MKKLLLSLCIPGIMIASSHSDQTLSYAWAKAETQGDRDYMEDTSQILTLKPTNQSLFAVFDGHGGNFASRAAAGISLNLAKKQNIKSVPELLLTSKSTGRYRLEDAFLHFEKQFLARGDTSGTTAVAALLEQQAKTWMLYLAWTGDSRGVLVDREGKVRYETIDHKFKGEELKRVQNAGGKVENGRVAGLAIPRSLGDSSVKKEAGQGVIIAHPDLEKIILSPQDNFLILASDGVWDNISSQEAATIVHNAYYNKKHYQDVQIKSGKETSGSNNAIKRAAKALMDEAYYLTPALQKSDNITVIVIKFDWKSKKIQPTRKANVQNDRTPKKMQPVIALTANIQNVLGYLYIKSNSLSSKKYYQQLIGAAQKALQNATLDILEENLSKITSHAGQQNSESDLDLAIYSQHLQIVVNLLKKNKCTDAMKEMDKLRKSLDH